jgi:hypothetical protein
MSNSLPPRPSGSISSNATKQLLEELDVLMQRMLALPVNELEDVDLQTGTEPDSPATPTATATAPLPAAERDAPVSERRPPEMIGPRRITAHDASPALPAPHRRQEPAPSESLPVEPAAPEPGDIPLTGFWPHPALQIPELRETLPRQTKTPSQASSPPVPRQSPSNSRLSQSTLRPPAGWWVHSLVWSNRTFDNCTFWLGRPGRWLQGRVGRTVLGLLGIGLLLGALALGLGEWFDWTW